MDWKKAEVTLIGFPYTMSKNSGRGIDRYLSSIVDYLENADYNYNIVEQGVVDGNFINFFPNTIKVMFKLLKCRSKVYHAVDPIGTFLAFATLKRGVITTIHDTIPLTNGADRPRQFRIPFLRLIMRLSLKISDRIIVPYSKTKLDLVDNYGINPENIDVINYGANLPELHSGQNNRNNNQFNILFTGSGNPKDRGLDTVLRIYERVMEKVPNCILTLVGNMKQLKDSVKEHPNLSDDSLVRLVEYVNEGEFYDFIGKFDVLLYPSPLGFSYLIFQAMHVGIPVIASKSRDTEEFTKDAAILCPPNDVECGASEIIRIYENPSMLGEMVNKGKLRVAEFSGSKMSEKTIEVYEKIIEAKKPTDLQIT